MAPKLLLVACVNWEGFSRAPYLFSQAGWVVDVFTLPTFFLAHSSFVNKIHAGDRPPSAFVDLLKTFLELHGQEYDKIILGDDPLISELASRRNEEWARALLPCTKTDEVIDFLIFKTNFIEGCQKTNISVPLSFVCTTAEQVANAVRELGFPLVLKRNQGHSGEGVKIIESEQELDSLDPSAGVLVQKLIEGRICSAAALYKDGALLGFYSYFRSRTWGKLGSSTAISFHVFPELAGMLEQLGRISKFDGLCGIDFMHETATSKVFILEQNFRPTLTMLLGRKVGVDFVSLLRNWNRPSGTPLLQQPVARKDVPLFPADILRAISQHDLAVLLRWMVDPRWIREMCWHDRKLLAHDLLHILRRLKGKVRSGFRRIW